MIKDAFLEMDLFTSAKETDNKLRWDFIHDDTKFSLYIPKWRVPEPWPSTIYVGIMERREDGEDSPNMSASDVSDDPSIRSEPIVAMVTKYSEHTKTIRYQPVGSPDSWEVGEPYVPTSLTHNESESLRVIVCWDARSRGQFS
jgi:hypothetical protein